MAKTGAVHSKNYREKRDANPEKREQYLEKRRLAYLKKKTEGKIKLIDQLTERGKRIQRKEWKNRQKICRDKKQETQVQVQARRVEHIPLVQSTEKVSAQKKRGLKIINKNRARCYRENHRLRTEIENKDREIRRLRKKVQRSGNSKSSDGRLTPINKTPRKSIDVTLKGKHVPKKIRQKLIFGETIMQSLKKTPPIIKRYVFSPSTLQILKRYRMLKYVREETGVSKQKIAQFIETRRKKNDMISQRIKKRTVMKNKVYDFYLNDDVSRVCNGKKLTVTKNKQKEQKRLLTDHLQILHKKFLIENPEISVSYSKFAKLRPFWVVPPTIRDRDTCLCKTCENLRLMLEALKHEGLTNLSNITQIPSSITCSDMTKDCAYRECTACATKEFLIEKEFDSNDEVQFPQWCVKKEMRTKINVSDGSTKPLEVTRTVKEECVEELYDFVQKFREAANRYCRHFYNIVHQFQQFKVLKDNLQDNECIIQIDFSENYNLKYATQIQSAHFGASLQQLSLHTGVIHVGNIKDPISFCSVSPNLQHGPPAIWQHLQPVFDFIKEHHSNVTMVHFYSDGPCSQYHQKHNFFLFATKLHEQGFKGTWNFWEAGHGRSACDGVGGAIKRKADESVLHGKDVSTAAEFYNCIKDSDSLIKIFFIPEDNIIKSFEYIPGLKPIPRTMMLHQVVTVSPNIITYRDVSCFCSHPLTCQCYSMSLHMFPRENLEEDSEEMPSEQHPKPHVQVAELSPNLINTWVVVKTKSNNLCPGIVVAINEIQVLVKYMFRSGRENKYFWPKRNEIVSFDPQNLWVMPTPENVKSVNIPDFMLKELQ